MSLLARWTWGNAAGAILAMVDAARGDGPLVVGGSAGLAQLLADTGRKVTVLVDKSREGRPFRLRARRASLRAVPRSEVGSCVLAAPQALDGVVEAVAAPLRDGGLLVLCAHLPPPELTRRILVAGL